METSLPQLLAVGLLAALASVLGALPLAPARLRADFRPLLRYLLALGAGFMLAVTLFEVLPKTITLWQERNPGGGEESLAVPMLLLLAGYLVTHFFEHTIAPHFHLGEEVHTDHVIPPGSAYAGIGGLLLHAFFDGISIAAALMIDLRIGFLVFIGIFFHKFPEGLTIGSLMLAAGRSFRAVLFAAALIGAATPVGVLAFYLVGTAATGTIAYALPFAAGVTLYVAASDLIPEVNHHGGGTPLVSLSLFGGVGLFFVIHTLIHGLLDH